MLKRNVALTLLAASLTLVISGTAIAKVVPSGQVTYPLSKWVRQSHLPIYHGKIRFVQAACPATQAEACVRINSRTIFMPAGFRAFAPGDARLAFYHLLGHLYRMYVLDSGSDFARFQAITGDTRRWSGPDPSGFSPADQAAQAYALCAYSPRSVTRPANVSPDTWQASGWHPTLAQHKRACTLFRKAWKRDQRGVYQT